MESTLNGGAARGEATRSKPRCARVGVPGAINELDPRKAVDYVSGLILDQIFEAPYATVEGQAAAEPRLFEPLRAEGGKKALEYSAGIRSGYFFSDGTPLTAELAARSLRATTVLKGKADIEARGDRIWFTLASPNPRFDLTLTQSACSIVLENGSEFFGTGPYAFEDRATLRALQQAPQLRLVRNRHDRRMTQIDEIEFHVLRPESDGTPRKLIEALAAGEIDLTTAVSASDLRTWKVPGVSPILKPSNSTAFLYMNTGKRPLDTAKARRAVAASIDLFEIASNSYDRNPAAFVATAALPPSMSRSVGTVRAGATDGSRLIQESGLQGARLSLLLPWSPRPYLLKPKAIAEIIQRRLTDAGVKLSLIETTSSEDYFRFLTAGRFDLALGGWIADTADPSDYFDALLASHAVGNRNFANHSRWSHPATDALLERFRTDPSDEYRRQLEKIIVDEAPLLPLMYGQSCVVHTRNIRNVTLSPTGSVPLAALTVA